MSPDTIQGSSTDTRSLASSLAPVVIEATEGRLSDIHWFKADWQRGGAATGHATWCSDDGTSRPVVLKFPVVERELRWTRRLQEPLDGETDIVVPHLFAGGPTLGGYDLAWIVIEHFEHGPLGLHWHEDHVSRTAEALARFQASAQRFEVDREPRFEDWPALLADSIENVRVQAIPREKEWKAALKKLKPRLDDLVAEWRARNTNGWTHGDAHLANAMSRTSIDHGPVCLIDLAEVHPGHWIEDAVYLERQFWARPERMGSAKPVKAVATARKRLGLPVREDYPRLAMIRRVLLAATAPKFIKSEGHPRHLEACLNWLEMGLGDLK